MVLLLTYMRKTPFVTGEFYHIYNRGVDKRSIFISDKDFDRFLQSMNIFNVIEPVGSIYEQAFIEKSQLGRRTSKLVNIVCFCLNKNHYHMLIKQLVDGGISEFMKRLGGGFTKYFNIKYKRSGVLLQSKFKSIHIDSNEYLLHLSTYINLNNHVHGLKSGMFRSSWDEYKNSSTEGICSKDIILEQFKNKKEYKIFAEDSLKDILARRELFKQIEPILLE